MVIEQHINNQQGYTLIELIISMVLMSIIFITASVFIAKPIEAYSSIASRAELVDSAELAIRRIERDIRQALPNSLRAKSTGLALEMVNVVEGLRYRAEGPGTATDILDFSSTDTEFNTLTNFNQSTLGSSGGYRLAIYNTGAQGTDSDAPTAGANVYSTSSAPGPDLPVGSHVITPVTTTVTLSNPSAEGHVLLSSGHQFALESPMQRLYVIDSPISYICDIANNTIMRYDNYNIVDTQPTSAGAAPLSAASGALLVNNVSACSFTYEPGTSQRNSVVTIALTLTDNASGESVSLLQQVSVSNVP